MQIRRIWRRIAIAALLLVLGWFAFSRLDEWNKRGQLLIAQREISGGELEIAQRRLTTLASRPSTLDGTADYWLGICEALLGRPDAALQAFGRVPEGYPFDSLAPTTKPRRI